LAIEAIAMTSLYHVSSNYNVNPAEKYYSGYDLLRCCCRNPVGVRPVTFLNTVLKVVFELKHPSKPTGRTVKFRSCNSVIRRGEPQTFNFITKELFHHSGQLAYQSIVIFFKLLYPASRNKASDQ